MVGRKLANGRYELLEHIGEGGAARVYRARDHHLGRDVAVKVLRPELAHDREFAERFRREATAAAGLCHPNIAQVFDIGSEDGLSYFVMEYIPGGTLRDRLRAVAKIPAERALEIAEEVASALRHAHGSGIVHRDIKPLNILFTREGDVKVVDFGIARALAQSSVSHSDMVVGSIHYISPEQAMGEAGSAQSDLYSLGVVLFEMLAGRTPYDGENLAAVVAQQTYGPIPDVLRYEPTVPQAVAAVLLRALAKHPNERFTSAQEMIDALREARQSIPSRGPVLSRPDLSDQLTRRMPRPAVIPQPPPVAYAPAPIERPMEPEGLSTLTWVLVTLTVIVLVAGVGILWWVRSPGGPGGTQPTTEAKVIATMPSLVGYAPIEAKRILRTAGIADDLVRIEYRDDDAHAPNVVLEQDPPPGVAWREGDRIRLLVSRAPSQAKEDLPTEVPDVVNLDAREAIQILSDLGLDPQVTPKETTLDVARDTVLEQHPQVGQRVKKGATVRIWVARPPSAAQPPAEPQAPTPPEGKTKTVPSTPPKAKEPDEPPPRTEPAPEPKEPEPSEPEPKTTEPTGPESGAPGPNNILPPAGNRPKPEGL